jgi:ABC-type branched-subunit amino acid transport system ATPase component/branched-subunit amino acid ABC-type transport system permease component
VDEFIALAIDGAITGTIYSLVASGLVLTYSTTGIFNFAAGGIAFATAWFYYELNTALGVPVVVAAVLALLIFAPLFGLVLDRLVFRHLARANETAKIVGTVGLSVAIPALVIWVIERGISFFDFDLDLNPAGGAVKGLGPFPKDVWTLWGSVTLSSDQLVTLVAAILSAVALWIVLGHTRIGLFMRAAKDRPALASLRGIDPNRTSAVSWAIGAMLAGLAGVVAMTDLRFGLKGLPYTQMLFVAATAAAIGFFRSVPMAFAGGMLLGFISSMIFRYMDDVFGFAKDIAGVKSSASYWVLLIVLLVLGATRGRSTGTVNADAPPPDYMRDLPAWRRRLPWTVVTLLLVAFALFAGETSQTLGTTNSIWFGLLAQGLALGVIFIAFTVVTGQGGMVSLAQTTFAAMGAITAGYFSMQQDVPFELAILIGAAAAMVVGAIVALPSLRLGGVALALATLALAFIGDLVLFQIDEFANVSGGSGGWILPRPDFGVFNFGPANNGDRYLILFLLGIVLLTTLAVTNLKRSASGRSIVAVRTAEAAASTSGISPVRTKLALFAVAAFIAGVGGALYASIGGSTNNPAVFEPTVGLFWVAVAVTFGVRRPGAVVVAAMVSQLIPQFLQQVLPNEFGLTFMRSGQIPTILFGLGAIQLARNPDGIVSLVGQQNWERRRRRAEKRAAKFEEGIVEIDEAVARAAAEEARIAALRAEEEAAIAAEVERHAQELVEQGLVHAEAAPLDAVAAPTDIALAVSGLRSGYGEVEVVHGIDFVAPRGQILGIFGANGAGKSTLCNTIGGLVRSTAGSILVDGVDISGESAHIRARHGVIVAPESRGIFPALSVEENLAVWLRSPADRERAYGRFPVLKERRRLSAGNLSGGEQQMLTLAPVLARPPRVLLADEPTLGLAPLVIDELMHVFTELRDRGVTLLLVEEKVRDVLDIADQIVFLELGNVIWSGPRAEVDDDRLRAAYLG